MKPLVFVSVSVLLFMGCSHSRFVLHDAAGEGLAKDSRRVEVSSKDRLSIRFRADGDIHGTPVVSAVAAEGQYLLVSSEEWETVKQIPRRYLSMSGLRVRSPASGLDEPTVALPVASIEEIRIEDKELRRQPVVEQLGKVPGWILKGAIGGFTAAASVYTYDRYNQDSEDPDILALSALFGVGGAVLYPTARLFLPEPRKTWRSHRSTGKGFRLESGD